MATLTLERQDGDATTVVAVWTSSTPVSRAAVALRRPTGTWTVDEPLDPLADDQTYTITGSTAPGRFTTYPISFTTTTLAGLSSDQVLSHEYVPELDEDADVVRDRAGFAAAFCGG